LDFLLRVFSREKAERFDEKNLELLFFRSQIFKKIKVNFFQRVSKKEVSPQEDSTEKTDFEIVSPLSSSKRFSILKFCQKKFE